MRPVPLELDQFVYLVVSASETNSIPQELNGRLASAAETPVPIVHLQPYCRVQVVALPATDARVPAHGDGICCLYKLAQDSLAGSATTC